MWFNGLFVSHLILWRQVCDFAKNVSFRSLVILTRTHQSTRTGCLYICIYISTLHVFTVIVHTLYTHTSGKIYYHLNRILS